MCGNASIPLLLMLIWSQLKTCVGRNMLLSSSSSGKMEEGEACSRWTDDAFPGGFSACVTLWAGHSGVVYCGPSSLCQELEGPFFFSSLLSAWHVSIIIIFIECVLFFKVISILETFSTFTDYRINSLNVIIEYLLASGCPTECFQTPFYVDFIKESVATHAVYTLCLLLLTVKSFLY